MPSKALKLFEDKLITEVDRLVDTHAYLNQHHYNGAQGRRGLGHITRSGIVMLCAAWERYIELVVPETVTHLANRAASPKELPKATQKELAKHVKGHKHELKALELAGAGWRAVYQALAIDQAGNLNTPKSTILDPLFEKLLGIETLSDCWSVGRGAVNEFVTTRGGIAHTGSAATYVKIETLRSSRDLIAKTVCETDNQLSEFVKELFPNASVPWRRRRLS